MKILAKGDSMFPSMQDGQLFDVDTSDACDYHEGDVIAYLCDKMVICHRIVRIIKTRNGSCFYFTKGDNNSEIDHFAVTDDLIIGRVIIE